MERHMQVIIKEKKQIKQIPLRYKRYVSKPCGQIREIKVNRREP